MKNLDKHFRAAHIQRNSRAKYATAAIFQLNVLSSIQYTCKIEQNNWFVECSIFAIDEITPNEKHKNISTRPISRAITNRIEIVWKAFDLQPFCGLNRFGLSACVCLLCGAFSSRFTVTAFKLKCSGNIFNRSYTIRHQQFNDKSFTKIEWFRRDRGNESVNGIQWQGFRWLFCSSLLILKSINKSTSDFNTRAIPEASSNPSRTDTNRTAVTRPREEFQLFCSFTFGAERHIYLSENGAIIYVCACAFI